MKNKHIELVRKWLADNDSVSPEQLRKSASAAAADYNVAAWDAAARAAWAPKSAAYAAAWATAAWAASEAAYAATAAYAAAWAADEATAAAYVSDAKYWVQEYEEITNGLSLLMGCSRHPTDAEEIESLKAGRDFWKSKYAGEVARRQSATKEQTNEQL